MKEDSKKGKQKEMNGKMNQAGGSFSSCDNEKLCFYSKKQAQKDEIFFLPVLFLYSSSSRMDEYEIEKGINITAKTLLFFFFG